MADQVVEKEKANMPPPASSSNQRWYVILIVAVVVSAGAGFFAGWQFGGRGEVRRDMNRELQGNSQRSRFDMMQGGFGTVTEVSDGSITIRSQFPMNRSQDTHEATTYTLSSSTKVTNSGVDADISDIKVGDTVRIRTDSNESKAAISIELNPSMRGGASASPRDTGPTGQGA